MRDSLFCLPIMLRECKYIYKVSVSHTRDRQHLRPYFYRTKGSSLHLGGRRRQKNILKYNCTYVNVVGMYLNTFRIKKYLLENLEECVSRSTTYGWFN